MGGGKIKKRQGLHSFMHTLNPPKSWELLTAVPAAMQAKLPTTVLETVHRQYARLLRQRSSPSICLSCSIKFHGIPKTSISPNHASRPFSTSHPHAKKASRGGKQESKRTVELNAQKSEGLDAFDFSVYNSAIQRAHEQLKSELAKIKAGGRNPESIENVRVKLDKNAKESVKLGDVASVVLRGRNIGVLVGEKDVSDPYLGVRGSERIRWETRWCISWPC